MLLSRDLCNDAVLLLYANCANYANLVICLSVTNAYLSGIGRVGEQCNRLAAMTNVSFPPLVKNFTRACEFILVAGAYSWHR